MIATQQRRTYATTFANHSHSYIYDIHKICHEISTRIEVRHSDSGEAQASAQFALPTHILIQCSVAWVCGASNLPQSIISIIYSWNICCRLPRTDILKRRPRHLPKTLFRRTNANLSRAMSIIETHAAEPAECRNSCTLPARRLSDAAEYDIALARGKLTVTHDYTFVSANALCV